MKNWNVCGFVAASGLLLSALATAELVSVMKSGGTDLTDEIKFFELHDTNFDGFQSKKEFYYAIMEDSFDLLARKYNKSSVEMEFELSDLNGDKKISVDEWKNFFLQGSEELQDVQYVEPSTAEEQAKPVPPSLPASQAFSGVASGKGPRGKMHIEAEELNDGRKAYLSENATWQETKLFCEEQGVRLCFENELCSLNGSKGINQDDALLLEAREKRWAPLAGFEHKGMELRTCGLYRWPEGHTHPGLIVCCEIEKIVSEPSVLTNVHYREAKNDGIEGSDLDIGDSGAGGSGGGGERGNASMLHSTEGGMEEEASEARKMVKPTAYIVV